MQNAYLSIIYTKFIYYKSGILKSIYGLSRYQWVIAKEHVVA